MHGEMMMLVIAILMPCLFPVVLSKNRCGTPRSNTPGHWLNWADCPFQIECPPKQYISRVESWFDDNRGDRVYRYNCTKGDISLECEWPADWINAYGVDFNYTCPDNHVIAGIHSYHSNTVNDRQWRYKCCKMNPGVTLRQCQMKRINNYEEKMDFALESGHVFFGFESVFSREKEDRIWHGHICRMEICLAEKIVIMQDMSAKLIDQKVVGLTTLQGCADFVDYTLQLANTDSVTETFSVGFGSSDTVSVGAEIGLEVSASACPCGLVSVGASVSLSAGYSHEWSSSQEKSSTTGSSSTAGQEMSFEGPGAAIIIGTVKHYEFDTRDIPVQYHYKCADSGIKYTENGSISLKASTYGQVNFLSRGKKFTEGSRKCGMQSENCITALQGNRIDEPNVIFDTFENCVAPGSKKIKKDGGNGSEHQYFDYRSLKDASAKYSIGKVLLFASTVSVFLISVGKLH